jgi:hypothetical protein
MERCYPRPMGSGTSSPLAHRSAELVSAIENADLSSVGTVDAAAWVAAIEADAAALAERAGELAELAGAIARVLPHLRSPELPADHALTILAAAAETLHRAVTERRDPTALAAARYQLDTLVPRPPEPDVPLSALRRKP